MSIRARAWCFTINNPTADEITMLESIEAAYIVYGMEVGEEGTPHVQGFIFWRNAKTLTAARRALGGRAHCEKKRGTFKEASDYCKKDGVFEERGRMRSTTCNRELIF